MDEIPTKTKIIFGLYILAGAILLFISGMFFSAMLINPLNPFASPTAGVIVLLFSGLFSLTCAFCVWDHNRQFRTQKSK